MVMVAALPRHLTSLTRFIGAELSDVERGKVRFVLADDVAEVIGGVPYEQVEKVVRGWKVKSKLLVRRNTIRLRKEF